MNRMVAIVSLASVAVLLGCEDGQLATSPDALALHEDFANPTAIASGTIEMTTAVALGVGGSTRIGRAFSGEPGQPAAAPRIRWTSNNPTIARVSSDGVVSALSEGSATVTAIVGRLDTEIQISISVSGIGEPPPDVGFSWPIEPENSDPGAFRSCDPYPDPDVPLCYWLGPSGSNWRDAQPFQQFANTTLPGLTPGEERYHLGADWNRGEGSDDEDLPVHSVADGVIAAILEGVPGWGRIVFVRHRVSERNIVSMYAHVAWLPGGPPQVGRVVSRGQPIAAVSDGDGRVDSPHLHFELRDGQDAGALFNGPGYTPYKRCVPRGPFCGGDFRDRYQGQLDPNLLISSRLVPVSPTSIPFAGRLLRGLAYDSGALWAVHSQQGGNGDVVRISKVDAESRQLLLESNEFNWNGRGITVGAGSLWIADALADAVHRVNPSTFVETGSFRTPGTEPTGIAFDGTSLWLVDPFFQTTYQIGLSGEAMSNFPIPNAFRNGLEWEDAGMWMNTGETELSFYLPSGDIAATGSLQVPSGTFVYDIAIGTGKVYLSAGDRIYIQNWPGPLMTTAPSRRTTER